MDKGGTAIGLNEYQRRLHDCLIDDEVRDNYVDVGRLFGMLGRPGQAVKALLKMLLRNPIILPVTQDDIMLHYTAYLVLGDIHLSTGELDSALDFHKKQLHLALSLGDAGAALVKESYTCLAAVYYEQGDLRKASTVIATRQIEPGPENTFTTLLNLVHVHGSMFPGFIGDSEIIEASDLVGISAWGFEVVYRSLLRSNMDRVVIGEGLGSFVVGFLELCVTRGERAKLPSVCMLVSEVKDILGDEGAATKYLEMYLTTTLSMVPDEDLRVCWDDSQVAIDHVMDRAAGGGGGEGYILSLVESTLEYVDLHDGVATSSFAVYLRTLYYGAVYNFVHS